MNTKRTQKQFLVTLAVLVLATYASEATASATSSQRGGLQGLYDWAKNKSMTTNQLKAKVEQTKTNFEKAKQVLNKHVDDNRNVSKNNNSQTVGNEITQHRITDPVKKAMVIVNKDPESNDKIYKMGQLAKQTLRLVNEYEKANAKNQRAQAALTARTQPKSGGTVRGAK